MTVVVQKFGGSSLADFDRLGLVADWVAASRRGSQNLLVVVSAMGKTTEELLTLARRAGEHGIPSPLEPPPRREVDLLVSTGERVSMALLAIALAARGIEAVSLTGSQAGIITSEQHFDARILEIRPRRIEAELERGRVVIVAGYQGVSRGGEVTTLGRGGSDTTAVALAAALDAERCEIYSDVDGVYTADPKRVSAARHLEQIDYDTLSAMADAGAKVLCARAVEFGRSRAIPIHARATLDFALHGHGRETRVVPRATAAARAVVVNPALCMATLDRAALPALERSLAQEGLAARDVVAAGDRAFVTLAVGGLPDVEGTRRKLEARRLPGFLLADCAELSAIGSDVGADPLRLSAAFASLVEPALLSVQRPERVSAIVRRETARDAEASWHQQFVECA